MSLHTPLTAETRRMIAAAARGGVTDQSNVRVSLVTAQAAPAALLEA